MKKHFFVLMLALASVGAQAAPGDGPTIDADQITIRGEIHGHITNGRQGGGGGVSVLGGLFGASGGANSTWGRVNVNGIHQDGRSIIKSGSVLLDTRLHRDILNNQGDVTVSGITQLGPR